MPRKIDVANLKTRSTALLAHVQTRIDKAIATNLDFYLIRWMCRMSAVEVHTIWERYVEKRLIAALNHDASHFVREEEIKGVKHVSSGLADYIVRGGGKFFDFRSMSQLIDKGNAWLGVNANPFCNLSKNDKQYIDALASIRNCIVHNSDAAQATYRRHLKSVYGITYAPGPDEFLFAKDNRQGSPFRYQPRLKGLAVVIDRAIRQS